jgi:hypothetical protein
LCSVFWRPLERNAPQPKHVAPIRHAS